MAHGPSHSAERRARASWSPPSNRGRIGTRRPLLVYGASLDLGVRSLLGATVARPSFAARAAHLTVAGPGPRLRAGPRSSGTASAPKDAPPSGSASFFGIGGAKSGPPLRGSPHAPRNRAARLRLAAARRRHSRPSQAWAPAARHPFGVVKHSHRGRKPFMRTTENLSLRLDPEVIRLARRAAQECRQTLREFFEQALRRHVAAVTKPEEQANLICLAMS